MSFSFKVRSNQTVSDRSRASDRDARFLFMRRGQSSDYLLRVIDCLAQRKLARVQTIAQFFALEHFSHDARRTVMSSDVIDGEDVGMIERGGGAGFLRKPLQTILII